jgi:hypothetical protein
MIVDASFQNLNKHAKNRNRSVIGGECWIIRLENRSEIGKLPFTGYNVMRKRHVEQNR